MCVLGLTSPLPQRYPPSPYRDGQTVLLPCGSRSCSSSCWLSMGSTSKGAFPTTSSSPSSGPPSSSFLMSSGRNIYQTRMDESLSNLPIPPSSVLPDSDNQPDAIPILPPIPTPSQSPHPVPPPLRRCSGLSTLDFSRLGRVVSSVLSAAAEGHPARNSVTSPTPSTGRNPSSTNRARPLRRQTPTHPGVLSHH